MDIANKLHIASRLVWVKEPVCMRSALP